MAETYDEASSVSAEGGDVVVDGPDGVAVTLTPNAAAETGGRLIDGAAQAQGQRIMDEHRKDSDKT